VRNGSPGADSSTRVAILATTAAAAATAFAALARAVAQRETARADRKARKRVAAPRQSTARDAAEALAHAGKWWSYVPVAAAAAAAVATSQGSEPRRRSGIAGAATILGTAVAAAVLNGTLDGVLPQPPAPPGRDSRRQPVFPSGHAFGTSAVAITGTYVFIREDVLPPSLAIPLALVLPLTASGARLLEDKHWISDVAGGLLAGTVLSSLGLCLYEATRGQCG
jgi:membrane-associated phospholipid phosphatase